MITYDIKSSKDGSDFKLESEHKSQHKWYISYANACQIATVARGFLKDSSPSHVI